ncbi:MAG: BON domain-containing protein [Bacteroidales bacterium]
MLRKAAIAALLVALIPAAAFAQVERRDGQIFKDVANAITNYSRFTVFDAVDTSVENGVVLLTGKVTMPFKRNEIAKRVARVQGVRQVINHIGVLPVSPFDDDLRLQIARAIYGNPSFWQYNSMANPPIHIIVEGGRVTLTGVVNNNVERMLARSLANGYNSFGVTDDLKTDAEMRSALERIR